MSNPQWKPAERVAQIDMDGEPFNGVSMIDLAQLKNPAHPGNKVSVVRCSQNGCENTYPLAGVWEQFTACDDCRKKAEDTQRTDRAKTYWDSICPPSFGDTDKKHAGFPIEQYNALRDYLGGESLLFFGPSGMGKSRLAVMLLKRCLHHSNAFVGIMWPEQLKHAKRSHEPLELIQKWGKYDLLLMDDALLTGAQDERVADFLKDVLDYRMRYKRHTIITSQIGGGAYEEQAGKFGETTEADKKRVEAILRRIREGFRVVSFAPVVVEAGQVSF